VDVHQLFNDWCRKEGVLMPKCEYPVNFPDMGMGFRAKQDI